MSKEIKEKNKTVLEDIIDYRDSIYHDIEKLEVHDRDCCDQAEYETLINVENSLSFIIKKHTEKE